MTVVRNQAHAKYSKSRVENVVYKYDDDDNDDGKSEDNMENSYDDDYDENSDDDKYHQSKEAKRTGKTKKDNRRITDLERKKQTNNKYCKLYEKVVNICLQSFFD